MATSKTSFKPLEKSPYNVEFVAGIKDGERQIRKGKKIRIHGEGELKKFLGLD